MLFCWDRIRPGPISHDLTRSDTTRHDPAPPNKYILHTLTKSDAITVQNIKDAKTVREGEKMTTAKVPLNGTHPIHHVRPVHLDAGYCFTSTAFILI